MGCLRGWRSSTVALTPASMIRFRQLRALPLLVGVLALSACADNIATGPLSTGLSASAEKGPSLPGLGEGLSNPTDGLKLHAIWWKKNQNSEIKVWQRIGPEGGVIEIPQTGLTMSFPAGAVASPLLITVTADTRYVAYKMEPSGTQFLKDVTVTQSLRTTSIYGQPLRDQLFAAYIADDRLKLSGSVPVLELEPSHTIFSPLSPLLPEAHVWIIRHFSRYMLASG